MRHNGVWSTQIEKEYLDKFSEKLPSLWYQVANHIPMLFWVVVVVVGGGEGAWREKLRCHNRQSMAHSIDPLDPRMIGKFLLRYSIGMHYLVKM
jgi:hypothetical protein